MARACPGASWSRRRPPSSSSTAMCSPWPRQAAAGRPSWQRPRSCSTAARSRRRSTTSSRRRCSRSASVRLRPRAHGEHADTVSRLYARIVVGLRLLVPVAWIAAAVLATIALPPLGNTGSAPLDDLVSGGGEAAQQQQLATQRFGFPLYTDTMVVQHDPRGLPPGSRERDARAALAVQQRRTRDLPQLRLVLPISDPKVTTAVNYLYFDDSANLDERGDMAERYASHH